jgi:hypothetical protein
MPGQFINTGNTPGGNLKLVNTADAGNLVMGKVGFTIYSSDFAAQYNGYGNEGDNTVFGIGGSYSAGQAYYGPIFSQDTGGNAAKANEILAYWNNNGLIPNNYSYLFNITYGPGSTVSSGIVVASFYYYDINNTHINIGTVDTSVPGWDTPGIDPFSIPCLNGTFYLPFTLSVYSPITQDVNDWC